MGIELALGVGSLALGAIGLFQQAGAASSASEDRKKAANAEKKRNAIISASTKIQGASERRAIVREERVRRARMLQASVNGGTGGSSGQAGGLSALGSNFFTLLDQQKSANLGNEGINKWNQKAVDFETKARETLAWSEVFQSGIRLGQSALSSDIWT
jgi:hypothetical protein